MTLLPADRARFQRSLVGALVLPLLLMGLLAGVFVWQVTALLAVTRWVDHTDEVIAQAHRTQELLLDMESGVRGYLLTGVVPFREPYTRASALVEGAFGDLRHLVRDNPSQMLRVDAMLPGLARWRRYARDAIALRDRSGDYAALVRTETGKRQIDALRAQMRSFVRTEEQLRDRRTLAGQRATTRVYIIGTVVALLLGAALAFLSRRQLLGVSESYAETLQLTRDQAAALQKSEQWLSTTLQSIGDAVIATDAQGRVAFMNRVARSLTGWSQEEAAGKELKEVFQIVNEQTRQEAESPVAKVMQSGKIVGLANHTVLIARDGTETPLDDSGAPIRDGQGQITGVVLVFRDVTERRAAERALQEADRRKDEFLAMLAHELRNPLGAVTNALQLLLHAVPSHPAWHRALEVIQRQVRHQTYLVDDLLDVSRITRGKIVLHLQEVDLTRLVREAAEDHRASLDAAGLTLHLAIPEEPLWVNGDPIRLTQVFGNLIQNTTKFTDAGGEVTVAVAAADGNRAAVTVRDTGIGIEPGMLGVIFDTFAQADRTLHRSPGGLGLGLALVKGLVELHGGTAHAWSDGRGRGTEFTVLLPTVERRAAPMRPSTPASPNPSSRRLRVLVVEDNQDAAQTLKELLELVGHEVEVAYAGPAGLDAARKLQPDVVLCDVGLPGMDGYAVATALRQEPAMAGVRLVALSGYGQAEDQRRSREAGFDRHLTKPVDLDELQRALAEMPEA